MPKDQKPIDDPELLKEKSLWQILVASQVIPDSGFNWFVGITTCCFFGIYGFLEKDTLRIYALLQKIGETSINVIFAILGFLIAGFTVFATLTKPKLLLHMARARHPISKLSYLKHNYFTFMRVFIYWLTLGALELLILFVGQKEGVIAAFTTRFPSLEDFLPFGNRMMLVISAGFFAFCFLQLKSFVFNVYHIVMTSIEFERFEEGE